MALVLTTILRDDLADQITLTIDAGPGVGALVFETSGDGEVATCDFVATSFGAAATGVITLQSTPRSDLSAVGGTIAQFSIFADNGGTPVKILEGTVTGISGGGDIEITSLVIVATEQVDLTSLTITVPAS
jgi:hypothetical protein